MDAAWWDPVLRFLAAAAYAGAIGFDRELRAKPAGLRTNIVVGVAAAGFGWISTEAFVAEGTSYDPSRVASQIVSGIGFLGGGAIFAAGGKPHGLTTAAALWGSAAAGLSAGLGEYHIGLALVGVTLIALWPLNLLSERVLLGRARSDTALHVIVDDLGDAGDVRALIREHGLRLVDLKLRPFGELVAMDLVIHGTRPQLRSLIDQLRTWEHIRFASEESVPRAERR
ncbi:MAG: MgtC/SapB family protein [Actinobacteria bacterium]|nr:MgtC/SapB family protein [Actinomycetota bacterium]